MEKRLDTCTENCDQNCKACHLNPENHKITPFKIVRGEIFAIRSCLSYLQKISERAFTEKEIEGFKRAKDFLRPLSSFGVQFSLFFYSFCIEKELISFNTDFAMNFETLYQRLTALPERGESREEIREIIDEIDENLEKADLILNLSQENMEESLALTILESMPSFGYPFLKRGPQKEAFENQYDLSKIITFEEIDRLLFKKVFFLGIDKTIFLFYHGYKSYILNKTDVLQEDEKYLVLKIDQQEFCYKKIRAISTEREFFGTLLIFSDRKKGGVDGTT